MKKEERIIFLTSGSLVNVCDRQTNVLHVAFCVCMLNKLEKKVLFLTRI